MADFLCKPLRLDEAELFLSTFINLEIDPNSMKTNDWIVRNFAGEMRHDMECLLATAHKRDVDTTFELNSSYPCGC